MEVSLTINDKLYKVSPSSVPLDTSLTTFIRNHAKLFGTKFMCLEGGCGACIVSMSGVHPVTNKQSTWAVNSCLVNIYSCHGFDITTIEGIGNRKDGYHVTQKRLADFHGTQCGYCSPGMVMNMYSLLESKDGQVSMDEVENSFGGNICRCTGYRPILDAFKSLATDADEKLIVACKDIEDLDKVCPKTGSPCAGKCHAAKKDIHVTFEDGKQWYKVYNVNDIFSVFDKMGDQPYMVVAGNSAHGVYRRSPDLNTFIDVTSVEELRAHSISYNLELGGGVSLTETMDILKTVCKKPGYEYTSEILNHMDLIGNVPVRNVGTIAGNLMIKNKHKEFPSDLVTMFASVGAKVVILETLSRIKTLSINDFINEDMNKKLIFKVLLPSLNPKTVCLTTYKIMPMAQNAHAYVNAAFLYEFNNSAREKILSATMCFGGIGSSFLHAKNTENFLVGKDIYNADVLNAAINMLSSEVNPDWVLPEATPGYRKNLAVSLFYKSILKTSSDDNIDPMYKTGGSQLIRPLSSGTQKIDTHEQNWPLTKSLPKIEGVMQCAGEAQFANDIVQQPNEVWVAFVEATKVNHVIDNIDATEALNIPGVVAFFAAKDIPGKNNFMPKLPMHEENDEIFCSTETAHYGQPIGLIVADTLSLASYAATKVKVTYKQSDKKVYTSLKQIQDENVEDRIFDQPYKIVPEVAVTDETHQFQGTFESGAQYHYFLEPFTCVCIPTDQGLDVHCSTQWMDITQIAISEALNISESAINMYVKRIGGGFGGKQSRPAQMASAAALAAHLLNRPVRFVMSMESSMNTAGKRHPCYGKYEVSLNENGKIGKLVNNFISDYGSALNAPAPLVACMFYKSCYAAEKWEVNTKAARTNTPSNTWCRAPGITEAIAMVETIMEHAAFTVGKDPYDVRMENIADDEMKKLFSEFAKSVDYKTRKAEIDEFNTKNRWTKRGIGMMPMKYPQAYFGTMHALVSIYHADGSVAITHGGIEMGQGLNTKVAQVASHILGIPISMINFKTTNSLTSPNAIVSGGSMVSDAIAHAVKNCCEILLKRMEPVKEELIDATWVDIAKACYSKDVDLCATFMYKHSDLQPYTIWVASCAEVEVDLLTGNMQVKRVDIIEDTGESMNPSIDIGQIEGAFVMGIGYWLTEKMIHHPDSGELLTNRSWFYRPPGPKDIPIDFRITMLPNSSNPGGVLRSKTTGEPGSCVAVVVLFALRHALNSARRGLNDDWYNLGAPTMPEDIFLLAGHSIQEYKLK